MYTPKLKIEKLCKFCEKLFFGRHNTVYCSITCKESSAKRNFDDIHYLEISKGSIGAVSELIAASELMIKGWEVFRACSPASNCDLLAMKNGVLLRLEVRTGRYTLGADLNISYSTTRLSDKAVIVVTLIDRKVHCIGFEI